MTNTKEPAILIPVSEFLRLKRFLEATLTPEQYQKLAALDIQYRENETTARRRR